MLYGGFYVTVLAKCFIGAEILRSGRGCLFLQRVREHFASPEQPRLPGSSGAGAAASSALPPLTSFLAKPVGSTELQSLWKMGPGTVEKESSLVLGSLSRMSWSGWVIPTATAP